MVLLRGADAAGARKAHEDAAVLERNDLMLDAAREQADLLDERLEGVHEAARASVPLASRALSEATAALG